MPEPSSNITPLPRRTEIRRGDVLHEGKPTGDQVDVEFPRRRPGKKKRRISMTMVDTEVMGKLELTGSEVRLLWTIGAHIPKQGGSTAFVQVVTLAKELHVQQSFVSRQLAELRKRRIITTPRVGEHIINPWILWNGMMDDWVDESEGWPEPIYSREPVDLTTGEVR